MKSREQGAIATFNGAFAFIRPDGADKDVFAHASELPTGFVSGAITESLGPSLHRFVLRAKLCRQGVRKRYDTTVFLHRSLRCVPDRCRD